MNTRLEDLKSAIRLYTRWYNDPDSTLYMDKLVAQLCLMAVREASKLNKELDNERESVKI